MNGYELRKKNIFKSIVITLFVMFLVLSTRAYASISTNLPKSTISDNFPTSYQSYITALKQKYPNATFKAVYTGLEWSTVLLHETYDVKAGISTIHKSYGDEWKKDGQDNYIDGPYVIASKAGVAYVLDPRNSLSEKYIFQFEYLRHNASLGVSVIEKVIKNTPMVGTYANKYKKSGSWVAMDLSYAQIINKIAQEQDVSAVYIAARMLQETSGDIVNNGSINGSVAGYEGYYNFFNIGATPSYNGATDSVVNGLKKAKDNGWTNPELSISGGVQRIRSTYIDYGQYSIYFQKFDVNNPYGNAKSLMAWQYQTNILAPRSEAVTTYNAYSANGMLGTSFVFYIPVYNNMPTEACPYPTINGAYYENDNTKVYLDDPSDASDDTINIRSSADDSSSANVIYTITEKADVNQKTIMTRTKKGVNTNWDYVEFTVGTQTVKGYVRSQYVFVYNYTKVTGISLDKTALQIVKGKTANLTAIINPTDAKYKDVTWTTSNGSIATVSSTGSVTAVAEGTVTITATTLDQAKIATCQVTVRNQPITLDKSSYTVVIGTDVTPTVVTTPNDAPYTLSSLNLAIAKVENGKIIGVSEGETKLTAIITATGEKVEATIKVLPTPQYVISETLNVKDQIITKVTPGTTVSGIKGKISATNLSVILKNANGIALTDTIKVGTGTKIELVNSLNQVVDTYNIVIYGDIDGNGEIDAVDLLRLKRHITGANVLSGLMYEAAGVSRDGTQPNAVDLLRIKRHIVGTTIIVQ